MKNFIFIFVFLLMSGCIGENVKKSKQSRERLDDRTTAALDATGTTEAPAPIVGAVAGSNNNVSVTIKGEVPHANAKATTKKTLDSKSVFDMSLKSVYEKVSGWLYLIMVIAAWGAWMLYRRISKSAEGKFLIGTVKSIYRAGKHITEEMVDYDRGSPEWNVLQKMKSKNQQELAEAQRNAPSKK